MTYQKSIKAHLARYKQERLGVQDSGTWKRNKRRYDHILPEPVKEQNILKPYRDDFWKYFKQEIQSGRKIKPHMDFHHLNSSQAMCFNLFFPFIQQPEYQPLLLKCLGIKQERITRLLFEHVADPIERTNFDFFIELESGRKLYFEIKLSEVGFGSIKKPGAAHLEKRKKVYLPRLKDTVLDRYRQPGYFFGHYQILRNISYLRYDSPDHLFFIFPKANKSIRREEEAIDAICSHMLKKKVSIVHVEDLALEIAREAETIGGRFRYHYREFAEKYVV